jgi:hypothetical protein
MAMNIAQMTPGVMIVRYKSVYKIREEHAELSTWVRREIEAAGRVSELAKSVISNDDADAIAKASGSDLASARSDVAALRKQFNLPAETLMGLTFGHRLAAILKEYATRSTALKADEERSRRFNEAWHSPAGDFLAPRTIH